MYSLPVITIFKKTGEVTLPYFAFSYKVITLTDYSLKDLNPGSAET
jgi:hypothetical protein